MFGKANHTYFGTLHVLTRRFMVSGHKLHLHRITAYTKIEAGGGGGVIKAIESIAEPSSVVGLGVAGANTLFS